MKERETRGAIRLRDIEEELSKKGKGSQSLLDCVPFGIALIAKDGSFLHINSWFTELFGYDPSDIPDGRTWFRKAFPDPVYRHNVISTWISNLEKFRTGNWRTQGLLSHL